MYANAIMPPYMYNHTYNSHMPYHITTTTFGPTLTLDWQQSWDRHSRGRWSMLLLLHTMHMSYHAILYPHYIGWVRRTSATYLTQTHSTFTAQRWKPRAESWAGQLPTRKPTQLKHESWFVLTGLKGGGSQPTHTIYI